jgi:uncharacterized peroxidase-related enzyme
MTAWIETRGYEEADDRLKAAFDATRGPHGTIDNVMRVHALRPGAMTASKALYKAALHDAANTLPGWQQEVIAAYVSILNGAAYSLTNHWANAAHLIDDPARAAAIRAALDAHRPEDALDGAALALCRFAEKLTRRPAEMTQADVAALRAAGLEDGEILEATQIIGYFNYVNRILNGLGVSNAGERIGFYG